MGLTLNDFAVHDYDAVMMTSYKFLFYWICQLLDYSYDAVEWLTKDTHEVDILALLELYKSQLKLC